MTPTSSTSSTRRPAIRSASSGPTPESVAAFVAAADALWPAATTPTGTVPSASQLGALQRFDDLYRRLPGDNARRDLRLVLRLLDSRSGALMLHGRPQPITSIDAATASAAMERMAASRSPMTRQAFKALKLLTGLIATTTADGVDISPVWDAMGYPGPDGPAPNVAKPITPVTIRESATWDADVVVVGSGAGGGVAAGVLAEAGLDVVVLERGGYYNAADFTHREGEATRDLFLDGALGATADSGIALLAGSALGGGTLINYTTSFATPERVRNEWDDAAGFDGVFTGEAYEEASTAVHERLGINRDHNWLSSREVLLEKGLANLGWHVDRMPRNAVGCPENGCGFCTMGCRHGARQCTSTTFLEDAASAGARIVVRADTRRIATVGGRVTAVESEVDGVPLTIRCRAVVVAAGALNTPAVLGRSGIGGPANGKYLRLHPVTAVWGKFDDRIDPWTGTIQSVYSDEFADIAESGHGFKFETAPTHPMFPSVFFGWENSRQYQGDVLALSHLQPIGILLRDRDPGHITLRRDGSPVWHYKISQRDQQHVRIAVQRAAEALAAAGAAEVISSTQPPKRWAPGGADISSFMTSVDAAGYGSNQTGYLSFHQMGSARMGSDPQTSVVGPDNQLHDTRGAYVMDASCFPTASGVNPMTTIQTIAYRGSRMLAESLS